MPSRQQADEDPLDHVRLAYDDLADLVRKTVDEGAFLGHKLVEGANVVHGGGLAWRAFVTRPGARARVLVRLCVTSRRTPLFLDRRRLLSRAGGPLTTFTLWQRASEPSSSEVFQVSCGLPARPACRPHPQRAPGLARRIQARSRARAGAPDPAGGRAPPDRVAAGRRALRDRAGPRPAPPAETTPPR